MTTIEHRCVEEVDSSSQVPTQAPLSRSDRFWIVFAALMGVIGTIATLILLAQPHKRNVGKKALKWNLAGYAVIIVLMLALTLSLVLVGQSTSVSPDVTPAASTPPRATSGSAAQASSLNLLPESYQDTPMQAAKELAHAWTYGYEFADPAVDTSYLDHAYACRNSSCGYTYALSQVGHMRIAVGPNGPKIVVDSASTNADGSFTATTTSYTAGANINLTFTAIWAHGQWGATSLQLQYTKTAA